MKINFTRWFVFTAILAGIVIAIVYHDHFDAATLEQWIKDAGIAGPIVFMLVYALGTVLFLPGSVLTLTGGALFGPILGTLYNLTGATIGA
ncbi:MAG: sulfurtransferase, partial [Gammaproteobacteria bacterium]